MIIYLSISMDKKTEPIKLKNKNQANYQMIQSSIRACTIELSKLIDFILSGVSFKCAVVKGMKDTDFLCQQLFCIDIDNDNADGELQTINDIEKIAKKNNLEICFSYYTFSHTESKPKFRVAFLSDTMIYSKEEVEAINKYLISLFNQADKVTYNASRLYLGTNKHLARELKEVTFNYKLILGLALKLEEDIQKEKDESNKIKAINKAIYSNIYSSDFDDMISRIKDYSIDYMNTYIEKAKNKGWICGINNCTSGTGKTGTGIDFWENNKVKILKCFSCGWSGDIIHYHRTLNNLEYIEAVKELARMFNIDYDFDKYKKKIIQVKKEIEEDKEDSDDVISDSRYDIVDPEYNTCTIANSIQDSIYDTCVTGNNDTITENELKKIDIKTKEDKFNNIVIQIEFTPNLTIEFIKNTVIKVATGGGKTYNLIQLCLNKIINKDSKKIIIMTSSNDLVNDFIEKLTLAIRELLSTYSSYFNYETIENLLKYANILKLNIDTEKIEDFSIYDIVITNQAYLFARGDTLKNSKKFDKLAELVNNNIDCYDLYIDEIHVLEQYKYSIIKLNQPVKSNENTSLARLYQKVNSYFLTNQSNNFIPVELSHKLALIEEDLNIFKYKFHDNGLINSSILLDNIDILDTKVLKKSCLKIIDNNYDLISIESLVDFKVNQSLINSNYNKSQIEFNNFVSSSVDKFIIENSLAIVNKITKKTIKFDNHLSFYDFVTTKFDYNLVIDMIKIINNNITINKKPLFNKILFIEKPQITVNCDKYYCSATIDSITEKYDIVKQKSTIQACKINKINVLFCSIDLLNRLKSKSSLSIVNLDKNLNQATNIVLSEKYKILDLEKKIKQIQANNLARTVIHYEKDTKTIVDDTKINIVKSDIKITYMQETRMTGTDFSETELVILDSKRSVNSNEKYNRYINKNNDITTIYKSNTQIVFNHAKQCLGRILRGDIEEKIIVVCLPDILEEKDINNNNVESVDKVENTFNTAEYIELFKAYFEEEFSFIDMNYTDYTNIKNKTYATKKIAEYLDIEKESITAIKKDRNQDIKDRYMELKASHPDESTIIKLIVDEFKIGERQLYRILGIQESKENKEEDIINYIKDCLANKITKTAIIKLLDEKYNIKKSKAYELFKIINNK